MMHLGLNAADRRAFQQVLRSPHTRTVRVYVQTLTGTTLAELTHVLVDGQIVVDVDAEITRSASLTYVDPARALSFDTNSPDDGAVYADRMLQIDYEIWVPALGKHVTATVFTGPVTKLDRVGENVTIEAQGKETLVSGAIWRPLTLKKGSYVTEGIKTLLIDRGGETRTNITFTDKKLAAARSLDRFSPIWQAAKKLARSLNFQLFYAANGIATLRPWPNSVVYGFRTGEGGDVLSNLGVAYEMSEVKNTIVVVGGTPKGAKSRIMVSAIADSTHPLSPDRLGRPGAPRYLVEKIDNPSLRSKKDATAYAKRVLEDRLREVVTVNFDALPIPHLEAGDLVRVTTDESSFTFRLRQFTIPLVTTGSPMMTVGYVKRTTVAARRRKRRPWNRTT